MFGFGLHLTFLWPLLVCVGMCSFRFDKCFHGGCLAFFHFYSLVDIAGSSLLRTYGRFVLE